MNLIKMHKVYLALFLSIAALLFLFLFPNDAYAAGEDERAPQVSKIQFQTDEVTKPGVIKVSLDLIEEETGIKSISLQLERLDENGNTLGSSIGGSAKNSVEYASCDLSLYTGTYTFEIPIPETAANGEWTVYGISLIDSVGNSSQYWRQNPKDQFPFGDYDEDPYLVEYKDPDSGHVACPNFKVKSEFDIAFQYGANNPNLATALENMEDGESGEVVVNSRNGYTIPADAFLAIKGKDKYLVISDDGVKWVFYGKDINDEVKSIDTRTTISMVSGSSYGVNDSVVQVDFADNGKLPGKAQIRLKSDYLYNKAGVKGTIYVYYKTENLLTLESSTDELVMDGTDKWCYFDVDHNSTFLLASKELSLAGKWLKGLKGWWYKYTDGSFAKGIKKIGGATYYFDAKGWMKTGWQHATGNSDWYYFNKSGAMKTGWLKSGGKWYYLNPTDGKMKTGFYNVGKTRYYSNGSGVMKTGWQKISNSWYYFASSGAMKTGWAKVSGKWYYLNSEGKMKTGKQVLSGKTYFLNSSGAMRTGWIKDGSAWRYANKSGVMQTSKWIGNYYVDANGTMLTNQWVKTNGKEYYVNKAGKWTGAKR